MSPSSRPVDPRSFPILGLIGAFACGPTTPQDTDSSTGDATTPTTDPTTDPTAPTTGPTPECLVDSDCDSYCGYCYDGVCGQGSCCGAQAPGSPSARAPWRCSTTSPRPDYCYSDDECGPGQICMTGDCMDVDCLRDEDCGFGSVCTRNACGSSPPIPLPGCEPPMADITFWNLGNAPTAFILADLDGDLDLDLAAGTPAAGSIEIHLNDGAGTFTLAGTFDVGPQNAGDMALAAGDVDADEDLDLAVVTRQAAPATLRLLFNDGAAFTVGAPRPIAPMPAQVFIADVDGDAALDLLTLSESGQTIGVQLGDGTGEFMPEQLDLLTGIAPRASVVEMTFDGPFDLLAPAVGGGSFDLWTGGQQPLLNPLRSFSAAEATAMAVLGGDLAVQGFPDIVLLHPLGRGGMVQIWPGIAPGEWTSGRRRLTTSRPLTGGLLANLDAQPGTDLIAATGQNSITVLSGDDADSFTCEHIFDLMGPSSPALLAVGDIDGDGFQDIVVGGLGTTDIVVIRPQL